MNRLKNNSTEQKTLKNEEEVKMNFSNQFIILSAIIHIIFLENGKRTAFIIE